MFGFKGLMAPVLTPFLDDGSHSLNLDVIPEYANFLLDNNIKAVLVNGTSGEGPSMTVDERKTVVESWVKIIKETKQKLMVQVGGACLKDVQDMAQHAEHFGADALLCLPELFFRPTTVEEIVSYLKIVGKAAPNTPLLYYHLPAFTGVNVNVPKLMEMAAIQIPTFSGVKFTSTNLEEGTQCLNVKNGTLSVFLGSDQIISGAFAQGFDSVIATTLNMIPRAIQSIQEATKISDVKKSCEEQKLLTQVIQAITRNGSWVNSMKAAMNVLTPINVGPPRPPLPQLSEAHLAQMRNELGELKVHCY